MSGLPLHRVRLLAWLAVGLLFVVAFGGCTGPGPSEREPLVQETIRVGEPLFDFGEAHHFGPEPYSGVKRINASFDVSPGLRGFGVSFQGSFNWLNSSATLQVDRPDGSGALELIAEEGAQDDVGEVSRVFQFYRFVPAQESQGWRVLMTGLGNISALDFRIHGIEEQETGWEETFTVDEEGLGLRLRVDARGWGEPPSGVLVAPDGSTTEVDLVDPRGGAVHDWTAQSGTYTVRFDTTGWGGSMSVEVLAV